MTRQLCIRALAIAGIWLIFGTLASALPASVAPDEAAAQVVTYPPFTPSEAITAIKAVALDDQPDSNPCGLGWSWIDVDLNKWAGGDWIYFCYQEGSPDNAVTGLKAIRNTTNCGAGWSRDTTNLHASAGGDDIYLCYQKTGGPPVVSLDVVTGITGLVACPYDNNDAWTKMPTDLNDGAGGLFIYLCYIDLAGLSGLDACGNEAEAPCIFFTRFFWENGSGTCDRGLRSLGDACVNGLGDHARYNQGEEVLAFQDSWTRWALQNQRQQLAWNEPLTSVLQIGAHNAYNNTADGYFLSNQTYSITDMLRAGVRLIELDVHSGNYDQTGTDPQLCHAQSSHVGCVSGDRDFYNAIKEIRFWLTRPENADEIVLLFLEAHVLDEDDQYVAGVLDLYLGGADIGLYTREDWVADGSSSLPSQAELVARGKRVIPYTNQKEIVPLLKEGDISASQDSIANAATKLDTTTCKYDGADVDQDFPKFRRVYDNRIFGGAGGEVRRVTPDELAGFAKCNITLIDIDDILDYDDDATRGDRLKSAIWSWAEGVRGQAGDAAYMDGQNQQRWFSAAPEMQYRFACYKQDGFGTGNDISTTEGVLIPWKVTAATGPWADGPGACEAEFPGSLFDVSRNGYENLLLQYALIDAQLSFTVDGVWLNHHDLNGDGWWSSRPLGALVGPNKTVEGKAAYYDFGFTEPVQITAVSCGAGSRNIHPTDDNAQLLGQTLTEGTIGCFFPSGPGSSSVTVTGTTDQDEATLGFAVTIENVAPALVPANIFAWNGNPLEKEVLEEALLPAPNPQNPDIVPVLGSVRDPGWDDQPLTGLIDWGDGTSEDLPDFGSLFDLDGLPVGGGPGACDRVCGIVGSIRGQHSWSTPGVYDIVVEVCDAEGAYTRATLYRVSVTGFVPAITLPAAATLDEGDSFSDTAIISVPDNADTYSVVLNYGDGSGFTTLPVTSGDTSLTLDHIYIDNGTYGIEAIICDDEGDCASDTTVVNVENLPPEIDPISDVTINEGEELQQTVTFSDPGAGDTHGWGVDFGDGTTTLPIPDFTRTGTSFDIAHTYVEDAVYTVRVAVGDDDIVSAIPIDTSLDSETFTVSVLNVAPSISGLPETLTFDEGEFFTQTVFVSDPGVDDALSYEIDYGDGTPVAGPAPLGDGILGLELQHTYLDDGTFTLAVTFCDDEDGCTTGNTAVTVRNVAPLVMVGGDATVDEGALFGRVGSFNDPGPDTWTATVDYGDGGGAQPLALNGTSFTFSHVYGDGEHDPYIVEVCVKDDDGGEGCASFHIVVLSAVDQVMLLGETIEGMGLPHGMAKSLLNVLGEVSVSLEAGALGDACNQLSALVNHVEAQVGKRLSPEQSVQIIGDVDRIRATIGCG